MAGELAYDPGTGQLVYSPDTGQLAMDCAGDCDPCTDSWGESITQDDATVTVSGSCSGSNCSGADGTYTFGSDGPTCGWSWNNGMYAFTVTSDGVGGFYGTVSRDGDIFAGSVTVTCDPTTHKLSVSGTLTGQDGGGTGEDCTGCSATVSV
jgi:hypothetical protein